MTLLVLAAPIILGLLVQRIEQLTVFPYIIRRDSQRSNFNVQSIKCDDFGGFCD